MGNKRLYFLTIFYIALFATIFKLTYIEVPVAALTVVIALLGFISAFISDYCIKKITQYRRENDEKEI